jgi:hypothetical protein
MRPFEDFVRVVIDPELPSTNRMATNCTHFRSLRCCDSVCFLRDFCRDSGAAGTRAHDPELTLARALRHAGRWWQGHGDWSMREAEGRYAKPWRTAGVERHARVCRRASPRGATHLAAPQVRQMQRVDRAPGLEAPDSAKAGKTLAHFQGKLRSRSSQKVFGSNAPAVPTRQRTMVIAIRVAAMVLMGVSSYCLQRSPQHDCCRPLNSRWDAGQPLAVL